MVYKQSTVIAYDEVPRFAELRGKLAPVLGESQKAQSLQAEGHHSTQPKVGAGFYADFER